MILKIAPAGQLLAILILGIRSDHAKQLTAPLKSHKNTSKTALTGPFLHD